MDVNFSCITYNVRGIRQKVKRVKIFNYIKDKLKNGFAFMQETHSDQNVTSLWKNEWGGDVIFNHGESNSRGILIAFSENFEFKLLQNLSDNEGRILLVSIEHNNRKFLLVNIYNDNVEQKQVILLKKVTEMMGNIDDILDHEIIMGGDWNFIFDKKFDAEGGSPLLKLSSIAEVTKIVEQFDLCDIFRVRYPDKKRFSFRQPNPRRSRRLDYFFISNSLQDSVLNSDILTSLSSDHSPVLVSFDDTITESKGSSYWKFNSLLLKNPEICAEIIDVIKKTKREFESIDPQLKWELVKYKVRCVCIDASKRLAKEKKRRTEIL